jgi:hypothetical protein
MTLQEFQAQVDEYATNNITAMMSTIKVTQNERDDLKRMYALLSSADKPKAAEYLKSKGVDIGA